MSISDGLLLLHDLPLPAAELPGTTGYRVVHAVGKKLLDELALIGARLFDVPVCLVLLDTEYNWLQAATEDGPARLPRHGSLCAAAIAQREVLRLQAAELHPSALISASVARQLHLARPLVHPLLTRRHHVIGSLCLVAAGPQPPEVVPQQVLAQVAAVASLLIELRASAAEAQAVASFWQQAAQELTTGLRHLLITANQLRQASSAADRARAWAHVQQQLASVRQRLS